MSTIRALLCYFGFHVWIYNGARLISNQIDVRTARRPVEIFWLCRHCHTTKKERV